MSRYWRRPPAFPVVHRDEVHVWRIPLAAPGGVVARLHPLLSDPEKARVAGMLGAKAVRRFVLSHGALRQILGRYLAQSPEQIDFVIDARGKPHLPPGADACFSLSHSRDLALCAVTRDRAIGVDVEQIRPVSAWREIAARYFSERENRALSALPDDRVLEAFFHGWTRKEAYAKALGQGVSQQWRQFSVPLAPGATAALPGVGGDAAAEHTFTLRPLPPGPGYVAAVAARGTGWRLCCWQWSWTSVV